MPPPPAPLPLYARLALLPDRVLVVTVVVPTFQMPPPSSLTPDVDGPAATVHRDRRTRTIDREILADCECPTCQRDRAVEPRLKGDRVPARCRGDLPTEGAIAADAGVRAIRDGERLSAGEERPG